MGKDINANRHGQCVGGLSCGWARATIATIARATIAEKSLFQPIWPHPNFRIKDRETDLQGVPLKVTPKKTSF